MRFLALLLMTSVAIAAEPPAPKISQSALQALSDRLDDHEARLQALEGKTTKSAYCDCPCNSGGKCVCPPGECPNGECVKASSWRTVGSKSNGMIPGYRNGEVVIYFAGPTAERLASEWACGESESPAVQTSGHYETQCSGGFCRRVWVPETIKTYQQTYRSSGGHYETRCSGGFCQRVWVP